MQNESFLPDYGGWLVSLYSCLLNKWTESTSPLFHKKWEMEPSELLHVNTTCVMGDGMVIHHIHNNK